MSYTIIVDGGAGRVICSIPALEKFVARNPDTNIVCHYWTPLFWGNSKLQDKVFEDGTKGLFDRIKNSKIFKPEPYYNNRYINQKISLIEAFDEEINNESELSVPNLYVSKTEIALALTEKAKYFDPTKKTIVLHPFGSAASASCGEIIDESNRSLTYKQTKYLLDSLQPNYNVLLLLHSNLIPFFENEKCLVVSEEIGIRVWMALIKTSDYVLAIDSLVQHIAYSFKIKGTVIVGGTSPTNVTYPGWFEVYQRDNVDVVYTPYRICSFDSYLSNMSNEKSMELTEYDLNKILTTINKDLRQNEKTTHVV